MKKAYTLVEMLIVVGIMTMLVAVSLPIAKKVMDGSRVREASRMLHAHFAMAKARSLQTGRPCGVELLCESPIGNNTIRQATKVFLTEVPADYSGGTTGAKAIIRVQSGVAQFLPLIPVVFGPDNPPQDGRMDDDANWDGISDPYDANGDSMVDVDFGELALLLSLIEQGESFTVQFDRRGPWFHCIRNGAVLTYLGTNNLESNSLPPQYNLGRSAGFAYAVRRSPKRVGNPMELVRGTAIDLPYSGFGRNGRELSAAQNRVAIMFTPGHGIDTVFIDSTAVAPSGTLHILVGRIEKLENPTSAAVWSEISTSNLADPESLWVSIGARNGVAATAENVPDSATIPSGLPAYLGSARAVAATREQMSGN